MRPHASMPRLLSVFLALLWACTCGEEEELGREKVERPGEEQGTQLQPLPEPPQLDVAKLPVGQAGELSVVAVRPQGKVQGPVRPTVTFSRPVKALSDLEGQKPDPSQPPFATLAPQVPGEWRWQGSASAEFVPDQQLPYGTEFEVTVHRGLRAIDGTALPQDVVFSFSTPAPELQGVSPDRGWEWLRPDEPLKLLFNQPVKELQKHATLRVEGEARPRPLSVVKVVSIAEERRATVRGQSPQEPLPPQERDFNNQQTRYELKAERPLPLNKSVRLSIDGSLRAEQGPLTLGAPVELPFRTYGPLAIEAVGACRGGHRCPNGPLVLQPSNPLELETLKGALRIDPRVEVDWERVQLLPPQTPGDAPREGPKVVLPGNFKPGTTYQVGVAAGVKDIFGQALGEPFAGEAETDDLTPAINTGGPNALIEASKGPQVPIEVVNIRDLEVDIWNLTPAEAAAALARPYELDELALRMADFSEALTLPFGRNERGVHKVDLSRVFGGMQTGLALVQVNSPNLRPRPKNGFRVLAQITHLATHFKLGPAKSLVWVTDLGSGKPVKDATVTIYDANGKVRWSGTSDEAGLADVPGTEELGLTTEYEWQAPFAMAVASLDLDTGICSSEWSEGLSPWDFNLAQGWEGAIPASAGFVFTDRGVYRPGEKVHVKGLARYRSVGELRAPEEGSELAVVIRDPRGEPIRSTTVQVNSWGTFSLEAELPGLAALGWYSVEAVGSTPAGPLAFNGAFRVAEYRAPQFKVDVSPAKPAVIAGEPLQARIDARYLFGGVMPNAKVRWSAQRESDTFAPKGLQDFTFAQATWWWDDEEPQPSTGFVASGTGALDDKGSFTAQVGEAEAPGERTWRVTIEAEVEDVNRQVVANRASVVVHPADFYVGVRTPTGFRSAGEEVAIDTLVVDTQGARAGGKPVTVELLYRTWKSVKQKDASGGFRTLSEPAEEKVHQCKLESKAEGPAPCAFTAGRPGFYVARATVTDGKGRRHTASAGLYLLGSGQVAWQQNDTERIDLVPDKDRYEVGETARVLVKSPYPEAKALITVEREGVLQRRVVDLRGSVSTVEVPISESMVPNVFVSALLVRPRTPQGGIEAGEDPGRPSVRVGLAQLEVQKTPKRLQVEVKPERVGYRPGEEVKVALAVKDWQGKGVPAEVTFYVVDEAVLRLTDYKTPDPLAEIFPLRPLSVRTGEPLIHLVRRRSYGEKGEEAGGGGGAEALGRLRSNFQTTIVFRPKLTTGADGTAQVSFKLPDNLTTFRVMAVAATKGSRFGSGEAKLEVSKPLLALPALPRFARVGDVFEAGVVIHARPEAEGEVVVKAEAQHARLTGASEQRVEVKAGAAREVRFAFAAETVGTATFRFRVQRGAEQDGVEVKLPVELPVALEAVATYGDTTDRKVEALAPPKNARPDVGGLELTLASTALGNFQEGFRQLVEYPYGCLEQQASRLLPFVSLRELAPQFGIPWTGPDKKQLEADRALNAFLAQYLFDPLDVSRERDPDKVVAETIRSMMALQQEDGSFRYWPDAWCADSWTSAYTTLALFRAKEVGYPVPPKALAKAQAYLAKVATGGCQPCERACSGETRVMAAYVLARTRKPLASAYDRLFADRGKLPLFSRALLADAMFVGGGDRQRAQQLLEDLLNHARETPRGVHFEEVQGQTYATAWHSDARTAGAVLQTLTTISPDHPYVSKIAHYLTSARQGGRWRSTQESAFSLIGLTELVRSKEKEAPNFVARVKLGDGALAQEDFRGRTTAVKSARIPMPALQEKTGGKQQQLSFVKEGPGTLYYSALLRYAPKEVPTKAVERGLFVQRWFEPYGGGGQGRRFYAGDLVRVRVRIASNQERHFAAIEIPLPAGLEAVDTSLASTGSLPRVPDEEGREVGYDYEGEEDQLGGDAEGGESAEELGLWARRFWSPFNHVEPRDSKVVVFADHLPPGIHVTSFVARATTPGTFVLSPAQAQLMYEPEVFGRSDGGKFEVLLRQEVSQRP